jgi:hypothetical protein
MAPDYIEAVPARDDPGVEEWGRMTALSCLGIGIAFLLAVGLLVFAGVMLGWVIPVLIERARERKDDPPPNTG